MNLDFQFYKLKSSRLKSTVQPSSTGPGGGGDPYLRGSSLAPAAPEQIETKAARWPHPE